MSLPLFEEARWEERIEEDVATHSRREATTNKKDVFLFIYYFPLSCGLNRVAIRPALGRTVRFFKALSGVRRSIKPDAYLSSFWDTPAGHRSVVCYDNPFSSQLVIYWRFVTLDVRYWCKRYPPASVWNDLGSHKPVCGGKRRAESTPFTLVVRVMVRVSVIYHRDRVMTGVNGRCRLWSSLTNANGFMRTQIGAHLPTPPPLPSAVGPRRAPPPPGWGVLLFNNS